MSPAEPSTRGTMVRKLDHGSCVPPQDIAMRKAVAEEMNRMPPSQSTRLNISVQVESRGLRRTKTGTQIKPMPQNGNIR